MRAKGDLHQLATCSLQQIAVFALLCACCVFHAYDRWPLILLAWLRARGHPASLSGHSQIAQPHCTCCRWLGPAVRRLLTLRIPLIQSQQFTDELATRLQAAPAVQQHLGDALERCALMASAACFAQAHAGGGSAGSSGGSGGVAPAPAGASPASEQSAPTAQARAQTYAEDAVAAVLEARWSPALLPPWPAAACSSASLARAPRLLDLISRMLAALPAKLPAAGARRGAFLTARMTTCCFAGRPCTAALNQMMRAVPQLQSAW